MNFELSPKGHSLPLNVSNSILLEVGLILIVCQNNALLLLLGVRWCMVGKASGKVGSHIYVGLIVDSCVACKPPSIIRTLGFVDNHRKWATVAREVTFGGSVASVIWGEQPAIETATMHSIFSVKSVFLGGTATTCENMSRSSMDGFPQVRGAESVQHTSRTRLKCI